VQPKHHHFATDGNSDKWDEEATSDRGKRAFKDLERARVISQSNSNLLLKGGRQQGDTVEQAGQKTLITTADNEETETHTTNLYQRENQKIEYASKSYASSAWCCTTDTAYDQSQFDTTRPAASASIPKPLTFREKVVAMMGWSACTKGGSSEAEQRITLDFTTPQPEPPVRQP